MEKFYEELKTLRERQDIELTEIQNRTKINLEILEAFERGEFDALPLPYIRLFLRAYVIEIGGDPDEALTQLEHYLSNKKYPEKAEPEASPTSSQDIPNLDPNSLSKKSPLAKRSNLIKAAVLILVWVFALIIIRKITLQGNEGVSGTPSSPIYREQVVTNQDIMLNYSENASRNQVLNVSAPYSLRIQGTRPGAYQISLDTLATRSITMPAGQTKSYVFDNGFDLLLSHTDGITIYLNSEPLREVGSHPYPVRVQFLAEPSTVTVKHYTPIN